MSSVGNGRHKILFATFNSSATLVLRNKFIDFILIHVQCIFYCLLIITNNTQYKVYITTVYLCNLNYIFWYFYVIIREL